MYNNEKTLIRTEALKPEHPPTCHPKLCKAKQRSQAPYSTEPCRPQICHPELVSGSIQHPHTAIPAFTLAEVLITLAIIGVVAAMAIPSVISNAQQQEFKTGLRKAVSVLNSAITMNIALDGETPYDNHDLFRYLQRHMSIIKSTTSLPYAEKTVTGRNSTKLHALKETFQRNSAFYTTDGMRFEFYTNTTYCTKDSAALGSSRQLHESKYGAHVCATLKTGEINPNYKCGSYGLNNNPNNTTVTPCLITVDVNGDKKPFPANANATSSNDNVLKIPAPESKKVADVFTIMITDSAAIPYGVIAQKAMYQAQR